MSGLFSRARWAGLWLCYLLFLVEVARLVAAGNTRLISVAVLLLFCAIAAQAQPLTLLLILVAVSPLPLYMQGLHASLTPAIVIGVGLSLVLARQRGGESSEVQPTRAYAWPIFAVVLTTLISFAHGSSDRTGADMGGVGRLLVGVAIFCGCLVCIRSAGDLRKAYVALGAAGVLVLAITAVQVGLPSVSIPGLLGGAGAIQTGESGLASNLRITGPVGDYELLGELLALAGVVATFFALRAQGAQRLLWGCMLGVFFIGIATTSTRSSFVILVAGIFLTLIANSSLRDARPTGAWLFVGASFVVAVPLLTILQRSVGTGFLLQRFAATHLTGSLSHALDRSGVWSYFMNRFPHGGSLLVGTGPSFDYKTYETYPHSLPLTLVFTVGIVGAIAFYCLLAIIIVRCARRWYLHGDPYAFLGGVLVLLFSVNEVKIEYLRTYNYQWFMWAVLGISAASSLGFSPKAADMEPDPPSSTLPRA